MSLQLPFALTSPAHCGADIANAKKVLDGLKKYHPSARGYEIAGSYWWQGAKDRGNAAHAERYEQNLGRLIEQLREDFDAKKAKFVCATLGHVKKGDGGNADHILEGQLAVNGTADRVKHKQFKGNVASVYALHCQGDCANCHYSGNAKTYMDVGRAMGAAMVELLQ